MVGFDGGERVSSPRLVQVLKACSWYGGGGEVGRALRLVLPDLLHEESLARLTKLHVDVQRLSVQLQVNLHEIFID